MYRDNIFILEVGAGQDPARDFAGSRVRNPAFFLICGILRDKSARTNPQKFLEKNPANAILPTSNLYLKRSVTDIERIKREKTNY